MIKRIGIDLDCVLNNLNEAWIEKYNEVYNDNLTLEDIKEWDLTKFVKPDCGRSIYNLLTDDLILNLKPLNDSVEVTKSLVKRYDIYVITATHYTNVQSKAEWILDHFPHINIEKLIICNHKNLIDVDLLIDDGGHNIEKFSGHTIVMDYAWNRYLDSSYLRAFNWLDVKELIDKINK